MDSFNNIEYYYYKIYLIKTDKFNEYIVDLSENNIDRYPDEYEVVYHISCKSIEITKLLEEYILQKLEPYRNTESKYNFLLPKDNYISLFINIFDESVEWFENTVHVIRPNQEN